MKKPTNHFKVILRRQIWWSDYHDTSAPLYIYWDADSERFNVGAYSTASRSGNKYSFTDDKIEAIRHDYDDFDVLFMLEPHYWYRSER